jgi:hypothetical protein
MRIAVLDSGAYDTLIDVAGAYDAARAAIDADDLEVLYTHVNVDELAATGDLDRRRRLLFAMVSLGQYVPTGTFMFGDERRPGDYHGSRLDAGRLADERDKPIIEALRRGNVHHTNDALIALTARYGHGVLAIRHNGDTTLADRARGVGIEAKTILELLAEFGYQPPP